MYCVGLFSLRTSLSLLFLFGRDRRFGGKRVICGRASGSTIPRSTHQFRQHVVPSDVIPIIQASYSARSLPVEPSGYTFSGWRGDLWGLCITLMLHIGGDIGECGGWCRIVSVISVIVVGGGLWVRSRRSRLSLWVSSDVLDINIP